MKIGNEEFAIQPESKRTMDVEITLFTLLVYAIILTYALGYLSWPLFYLLFHPAYMRVFMGNHDRFHADKSRRWPKPVEWFSETFGVVVTPWDEPYDSIRLKHFQHHLSHLPGKTPDHDTFMDPHAMYEAGGFWRSLLCSMFYEEVQLIHDIRHRCIARSRWVRLAIYTPILAMFIAYFGWEKYLGVFFAVRLMSASGWFTFSWLLHAHVYEFGILKKIPGAKLVLAMLGVMNGKRVRDGFFRHAAHHAWPHVPSGQLYLLDEAVTRNPEEMPSMARTHHESPGQRVPA